MVNFEVNIDQKGFHRVGVEPVFDEARYGQMLNEFTEGDHQLRVNLAPHHSWGRSQIGHLAFVMARRQHGGVYDPKTQSLNVDCYPDPMSTNTTLLHETKHFFQDTSGQLKTEQNKQRRKQLLQLGSTVLAGGGISLPLLLNVPAEIPYMILASSPLMLAVPAVMALRYRLERFSPFEVEAQDFATSPEITQSYGNIIRYRQIPD